MLIKARTESDSRAIEAIMKGKVALKGRFWAA